MDKTAWAILFALLLTCCSAQPLPPEISDALPQPTYSVVQTLPAETESLYSREDYTLKDGPNFYQGQYPLSEIQTITFSHDAPFEYDEKWSASETGADCLIGYRAGNHVFIVGERIYSSWRCSYMFAGHDNYDEPIWSNLESIEGLELIDTSNAKEMKLMFAYTKLECLDGIENWDVSRVSDFSGMFQGHSNSGDSKFKELNVSSWNTSHALSMSHMFYGCAQLTSIPIDNWDVSKVGNFSHMFADCYNLQNLNFSNWETTNVVSFDAFLNDCHSLIQIDVSALDTSTCEQFSQMFEACINLEEIVGINEWDVSNASYYAFSETFHCCYKLTSLNLSNWNAIPDNTARMFKNCKSLVYLDISGLDLSQIKTDLEMYDGCENLKIS